ncbi:hypothetical protein ACFCV3_37980 [Kribbella sp. NPDC056345]|uniref:hypothetical protein n=1 Tax=Kribbella sp. NPDC056345 TaxID=3345789 RepID=UPI0035DAEDF4
MISATVAPANFWTENKDLLALGVSLLALLLSIITARQNAKLTQEVARNSAAHAESMARTATYQRIHELLIDPASARGRRRLFRSAQQGCFPNLGEDGWDEINYSLALYDTLAGYMHRDQVDEHVVLEAWHHPLTNIAEPVRQFMAFRVAHGVNQPWSHLMQLIARAEQHICQCPDAESSGAPETTTPDGE